MLTGRQLQIVRSALGLSQQDMAEIMYCSRPQISYIESEKSNGKKPLNYYTLAVKEVFMASFSFRLFFISLKG